MMKTMLGTKGFRAGLCAAATILLGLGLAGSASAIPVTIAFDSFEGNFDPNAPVDPLYGPSTWLEGGTRTTGFWLTNAGTPNGAAVQGHLHLVGENDEPFPIVGEQSHAWDNDLQGLTVTLDAGALVFDLISVDYRIQTRDTPPGFENAIERLPWSYAVDDTRLLISEGPLVAATPDFAAFEAQFTAIQIDDGTVYDNGDGTFDPNRPADFVLRTAVVDGFDNLTSLNLSHTGGFVWIDNIVIDVKSMSSIPEPGTGLLFGAGLMGLAVAARRVRSEA